MGHIACTGPGCPHCPPPSQDNDPNHPSWETKWMPDPPEWAADDLEEPTEEEKKMTLTLERKGQENRTLEIGPVAITPPLDEDYWTYRVRLTDTQAIVGFPKYSTIGIGFAVEDYSWNTNLPYRCKTEEIVAHIALNAGDESITVEQMVEAVELIRRAAYEDRKPEDDGRFDAEVLPVADLDSLKAQVDEERAEWKREQEEDDQ